MVYLHDPLSLPLQNTLLLHVTDSLYSPCNASPHQACSCSAFHSYTYPYAQCHLPFLMQVDSLLPIFNSSWLHPLPHGLLAFPPLLNHSPLFTMCNTLFPVPPHLPDVSLCIAAHPSGVPLCSSIELPSLPHGGAIPTAAAARLNPFSSHV